MPVNETYARQFQGLLGTIVPVRPKLASLSLKEQLTMSPLNNHVSVTLVTQLTVSQCPNFISSGRGRGNPLEVGFVCSSLLMFQGLNSEIPIDCPVGFWLVGSTNQRVPRVSRVSPAEILSTCSHLLNARHWPLLLKVLSP